MSEYMSVQRDEERPKLDTTLADMESDNSLSTKHGDIPSVFGPHVKDYVLFP
jgi:hypothetical protein